ncbi:acyltransferase family protein [Prosthecobacter fluviatilis]|uniref:Acyltransferase family protein n=1 Tax=Prosthecobacter fluviatilis TaxID=445931 RepID=A0ABW0KLX0_9BACT
MTSASPRLPVVDMLRGFAALAVCWYHFTNGSANFLPEGLLKSSGTHGWLGVEVFFVISGFIIPYALQRSGYRMADYGRFILRRIIRLDPPYLASIVILLVLGYVCSALPGFRGPPFEPTFVQVVLHLGYLNALAGQPWLNPAFWTLAIELQYYLLVGLLFPVLAHRAAGVRVAAFAVLACLAVLLPAEQHLFHWLFLFMLGMAAFQLRVGLLGRSGFWLGVLLLGGGAWLVNGGLIAATAAATALLLGLSGPKEHPIFLFLGQISYSLYLLHIPVGSRVVNFSQKFDLSMPGRLAALLAAVAVSIGAAWLLYRCVELPAQRWSSSLRYRERGTQKNDAPATAADSPGTAAL